MKIRNAYTRGNGPTIDCGETLTEQAHKNETDMNYILRDYAKTGFLKHAQKHEGRYDDVTVTDFQDALLTVNNTQNMFNQLPAQIRDRFANNPAQFLEYVSNPANENEMATLGILKGNDGLDINGTARIVPTQAHYDQVRAENIAAAEAAAKLSPAE